MKFVKNNKPIKPSVKLNTQFSTFVPANKALYVANGGAKFRFSEDTIRRVLHEQKDKLCKNNNWVGLLFSTVSMWSMLLVSEFKPLLGVSADTLRGGFIVVCLGFSVWLVISAVSAWCNRSKDLVTEIVEKLKEYSE